MEKFNECIDALEGKRITSIVRALDELIVELESGEITLHILSKWRIVNQDKDNIRVAAMDVYLPADGKDYSDDFQWEKVGETMFDDKMQAWFEKSTPLYIKECSVSKYGDLFIELSCLDCWEIYVDVSNEVECWYICQQGKKDKIGVGGKGYYIV